MVLVKLGIAQVTYPEGSPRRPGESWMENYMSPKTPKAGQTMIIGQEFSVIRTCGRTPDCRA
ncbi:hypothetical protein ACFY7Z_15080 [Streptomyces sp. NPDC012623]|uniref:hypothetical protein n=1 Tax=unclassified Streptomyces TaxID=2593676 RepID=UPI0036B4E86C